MFQLKDVWGQLSQTVKDNLWDYIQIICLLAEKVTGQNQLITTRDRLKKEGRLK